MKVGRSISPVLHVKLVAIATSLERSHNRFGHYQIKSNQIKFICRHKRTMKHVITQQDITSARSKGSMNCSDMGPTTRDNDKLARHHKMYRKSDKSHDLSNDGSANLENFVSIGSVVFEITCVTSQPLKTKKRKPLAKHIAHLAGCVVVLASFVS